MKKVLIFGMVALMLAFGVSAAFADPVSGNVDSLTVDGSGSAGSQVSGQGDVNGVGVQTVFDHKSFDSSTTTIDESGQVNTKTYGSGNTATIDKSGQVNTKTYDSGNTKTVTVDNNNSTDVLSGNTATFDKSGQNNALCSEAEKNIAGSQASGSGNSATNTNTVSLGSDNTKTLWSGNSTTVTKTDVDLKQITKGGSAASYSGSATVTKGSNNSLTYDGSGQTNCSNNTVTKNTTVDESGQTNLKYSKVDNYAGAQNVGNNNTATSEYTKTTTIDKSGQINCSYNAKGSFNSTTVTKYSGNAFGSGNSVYAVDDQVLVNNNSGISISAFDSNGSDAALQGQNLTCNKTFSNSVSGSIQNVNGVVNVGQTAGNFNGATATTGFTLNGGVANTTP